MPHIITRATRLLLGAALLAASACGGEIAPVAATGDGGSAGDGAGGGGGSEPSLADQLEGDWTLVSATCAGSERAQLYDDKAVYTFAAESLVFSFDSPKCIQSVPYTVTYEEASFTAEPHGIIECLPAGCGELCDQDAAAVPSPAAEVELSGDTLTLTTSDPAALAAFACGGSGEIAVETYTRGKPHREPFDPNTIDAAVCDGFDAFGSGRTVYYVAQNEPGANDVTCDGLAPTDEGGGHCPFVSFASARVRELMFWNGTGNGVNSVTVVLRDGVYPIEPMDLPSGHTGVPLWIHGNGKSLDEAMALVAYPGEQPVLDGTCNASIPGCDSPEDPGRIWELLALRGSWVYVQGLTFDNVHKWNVSVHGSSTCILDNTFIGSYGSDSDSMKSGTSGPNVIVRGNDFSTGYEQAIDATGARGWLIEDNDFHDAPGRGVGFKYGASGNIVRGNRFDNLGQIGVALGGGSSLHTYPYEAANIIAEENHATTLGGAFAEVFACTDCKVWNNTVEDVRIGIRILDDENPSGCPGGCPVSDITGVSGNRFRGLVGHVDSNPEATVPPNAFIIVYPPALVSFSAGGNLYCLEPGDEVFALDAMIMDHDSWSDALMTDETSTLAAGTSPECLAW